MAVGEFTKEEAEAAYRVLHKMALDYSDGWELKDWRDFRVLFLFLLAAHQAAPREDLVDGSEG